MKTQNKILIGVTVTLVLAASISAYLYLKGKKQKDAKTTKQDAEKPANSTDKLNIIKKIKQSLAETNIDAFEGIADAQYSKLSAQELRSLLYAIQNRKKYTSESQFKANDLPSYNTITSSLIKITSK